MQRAITIHSFEHACAALEAAVELSAPVTLLSAPDAGLQSGPAWFASVVKQAIEAVPGSSVVEPVAVLDCGDKPGCVLAALRQGLQRLCFHGEAPVRAKLLDIAESQGATIISQRPESLDLLRSSDPLADCRAWLAAVRD